MKKSTVFISYCVGLILSTILTFAGYIVATIHIQSHHEVISHSVFIPLVLLLAFLQFFVQLSFFLHLWKKDSTSRWNLFFFIITFIGILVIVVGSVWIMYHLNYNMTPNQMNQYINDQSGF